MKIKRNHDKIIDELARTHEYLLLSIVYNLFSDKDYSTFDIPKEAQNGTTFIATIAAKSKIYNYKKCLSIVIKRNNLTIGKKFNTKMNFEDIKDIIKEMKGISKGKAKGYYMYMLLFFFSKHIFMGETVEKLREICKTDIVNYTTHLKKRGAPKPRIELHEELKGTKTETLFQDFIWEYRSVKNYFLPSKIIDVQRKLGCSYNPVKKTFGNVKRGALIFLMHHFNLLAKQHDELIKLTYNKMDIEKNTKETLEDLQKLRNGYIADKERTLKLKSAMKSLKKENKRLNEQVLKKIDKSSNRDLENRVHNLQKENNYNLSRIEKMEEQIALLEEEKKLNKNLVDDIVIDEKPPTKGLELPEYQNIVVMGGRWNSTNRKEVCDYLATNEVDFIEADKTLRHFDRIAHADIIFYDTTYNGHDYYYKAKKCNAVFYHINHSNLLEFKKIFENIES